MNDEPQSQVHEPRPSVNSINSDASAIGTSSKEALLAEYAIAHQEIVRLNSQLWTTAQLLVPLSLAGIGYFASMADYSIHTLLATIITGLGSSMTILGWYRIARRWMIYQDIAQMRIQEIETEIGAWCVRYQMYAGAKSRNNIFALSWLKGVSRPSLDKLPVLGRGSTQAIIRNLAILMIITWMAVVLMEIGILCHFF